MKGLSLELHLVQILLVSHLPWLCLLFFFFCVENIFQYLAPQGDHPQTVHSSALTVATCKEENFLVGTPSEADLR